MNLILWRHAEAEDIGPDGTDASRRLTKCGQKQASGMAAWLNQHLPADTTIIASPATRTQQTADALQRPYTTDQRLFTTASVADYLATSLWGKSEQTIVLVGHQPTLGQLAALLMCGEAQPWSVKKGAVWWMERNDQKSPHALLRAVRSTAPV